MPKVVPLPIGQDVMLLQGLSEQSQTMIARRNQMGLATYGSSYAWQDSAVINTWLNPPWPGIDRCVLDSGNVWVNFGVGSDAFTTYGSTADSGFTGVSVDGATPFALTMTEAPGYVAPVIMYSSSTVLGAAITGLTPGWHTFTLNVYNHHQTGGTGPFNLTWTPVFLTVWPV